MGADIQGKVSLVTSRKKRQRSQDHTDLEIRRQARRDLVVLLSALFFFLLFLIPAIILGEMSAVRLGVTKVQLILAIPLFLVVVAISIFVAAIARSIAWRFAMSFYLTVDEWQELGRMPDFNIPIFRAIDTCISHRMLAWKISRESKIRQS